VAAGPISKRALTFVALAKELSATGLSLCKISTALAARGHFTAGGKPYVASAVQEMLRPNLGIEKVASAVSAD
jgi:hypothetical protein